MSIVAYADGIKALRGTYLDQPAAAAIFFLFGIAAIMLYRYAVFGEIDWPGLASFGSLVLLPLMQHFQNRHEIKRDAANAANARPPLVNDVKHVFRLPVQK